MLKQLFLAALAPLALAAPASAIDLETRRLGEEIADRAEAFLRSRQDEETGAWALRPNGPQFPAISALVLDGLLMDPRTDQNDPQVARGIDWVLSFRKPDGGIYDTLPDGTGVLSTYNTAICLSMLTRVHSAEAGAAVQDGVALLKNLQWQESGSRMPDAPNAGEPVPESHPYYGGWGYGNHGRPDISNTQFALQAFEDAGVSADDPAVQRALVFLRRVQMHADVNDMPYAESTRQGGFIYATVPNAESVDSVPGQSQAGAFEETLPDGRTVRNWRSYGSVSYAGFKSLIFADVPRDDPRIEAVLGWIRENYTLDTNPGMGDEGYYYYLLSFGRAMDALDSPTLEVAAGGETREADWAADLIRTLATLQEPDGSFRVRSARWMEDNDVLITAYALIALHHALGHD